MSIVHLEIERQPNGQRSTRANFSGLIGQRSRQDLHTKFLIVCCTTVVFLLSANIAWLNPRPHWGPHLKFSERIPILWQYGPDEVAELYSAAYFPAYFRQNPMRVNRPTYPALVGLLSRPLVAALESFTDLPRRDCSLWGTAAAYVLMKYALYVSAAIVLFKLSRRWLDAPFAMFAVLLLLFSHKAIWNAAKFHTGELQFITPIFVAAGAYSLYGNYSLKKNVVLSILLGVAMLAKQNYAAYLAVLLVSTARGNLGKVMISVAAHALPLLVWLGVLWLLRIDYYNHELELGSLTWLTDWFTGHSDVSPLSRVSHVSLEFGKGLVKHFSIPLVAAAFFMFSRNTLIDDRGEQRTVLGFGAALLFMTFVQYFVAARGESYMVGDLSVVVFPLAAAFAQRFCTPRPDRVKNWRLVSVLGAFWLLLNVARVATFPWVHPFHQELVR